MELMVVKDKRDVKPLLLKLGITLALSVAGFLVSHLRFRLRPHPKKSPSRPATGGGLKDELRILKSEEAMAKVINGTSTTTTTTTTTTTFVGLSPTSKSSGDEEGFLLPEFNDLVMKEFEVTGRDPETKDQNREEIPPVEREIAHLRSLVWSLRERERSLELELLEYYGMQEQEAAVRELESQLKINTVEAKLSSLKIESLEAENRRLQAQVSEHSRTVGELDAARAKIKLLKRKMKSEGEQARDRIVSMLKEREQKHGKDNAEVEKKLKRVKDLEDERMYLRKVNSRLEQENLDLMRRLEAAQTLCSDGPEAKLLDETKRLSQANDKLTKEIDQLRTDRCGDVEELVYLKWVNACLRYELRNYHAPPGKTVARDLSNNMSPKSKEKAKQLILEYANSGAGEKSMGLMDFDSEDYVSSQASTAESEDTSTDACPTKHTSSNKSKFLHKLKKLVLGKDCRSHRVSSVDRTPPSGGNSGRRTSLSACSFDDMIGRDSYDISSSSMTEELGARASNHKRMASREESSVGSSQHDRLSHDDAELKKFAQVFKDSRPNLDGRSS